VKSRFVGLLILSGIVAILLWMNRGTPLPEYFLKPARTLEQALDESRRTGRPVFALATADWCGPCQEFKAGGLRDERVARWVAEHAVPVHLDVTSDHSPGAEPAARLGVRSIPAIFLIRDGETVGSHSGALGGSDLLKWLETFSKVEVTPAD
jgi:thioredoxin 1